MKTRLYYFIIFYLNILFIWSLSIGFAQSSQKKAIDNLTDFSYGLQVLADQVSPSVVQIFSTGYGPGSGDGAGSILAKQRSSGSGVVLSNDGYIVTNAHVVDGAEKLQVMLAIPREKHITQSSILKLQGEVLDAELIGVDVETDLAVLNVAGTSLPFLKFGDSDQLRQGQIVLAFGSPLGLQNSVTMGIISSVARQLKDEDPMIYLQTDAPINPGNSGGPLINIKGEVVGINTSIFSQSGGNEGIGFAAPSNIVKNVYEQIRKTGRVKRGDIGVYVQTITPTLTAALNLKRNWGVLIADVYPNSPAFKSGLKVGDIILTLENKVMENGRQFNVNLYRWTDKGEVKLDLIRGAENLTVKVPVVERDDDPYRFFELVNPAQNLVPKFGILAIDLDNKILQMLPPLRKQIGVLVAARSRDAIFREGGFYPGDVIYSVNNTPITSLTGLRSELSKYKSGDAIAVQVERRRQLRYIAFELD
jgi:serine protease Do